MKSVPTSAQMRYRPGTRPNTRNVPRSSVSRERVVDQPWVRDSGSAMHANVRQGIAVLVEHPPADGDERHQRNVDALAHFAVGQLNRSRRCGRVGRLLDERVRQMSRTIAKRFRRHAILTRRKAREREPALLVRAGVVRSHPADSEQPDVHARDRQVRAALGNPATDDRCAGAWRRGILPRGGRGRARAPTCAAPTSSSVAISLDMSHLSSA